MLDALDFGIRSRCRTVQKTRARPIGASHPTTTSSPLPGIPRAKGRRKEGSSKTKWDGELPTSEGRTREECYFLLGQKKVYARRTTCVKLYRVCARLLYFVYQRCDFTAKEVVYVEDHPHPFLPSPIGRGDGGEGILDCCYRVLGSAQFHAISIGGILHF